MQISDYLWQRARPTTRRTARHRRRPTARKQPSSVPARTDIVLPQPSLSSTSHIADPSAPTSLAKNPERRVSTPVSATKKIRATVRIDYRDAGTGERIVSPKLISGHLGMRLALNYPAFPDRIFVRITGFTPTFVRRHKVITLYYIKAAGAPVLVFHRDQDGQLLCPAERLTGNLDQPYTAKCLDYFRDLVLTPQTIQGTFTKHVRVLTFRYQVTPIEPLLLPSVAYVELLADKQVYESPVSAVPLPVQLPRGTFWRVFAAAQTTTDHQVWLSLGGAQWLTNNKTRPHQQNPYLRGK